MVGRSNVYRLDDEEYVHASMIAKTKPAEKVIFATYPEIPKVEFLGGTYVADRFDAHMHEFFTIGVTLEGTERFWCRGAEHTARVGQVALLNPHEVHKGGPGSEGWWTYQTVYVSPEVLEWAGAEVFKPPRQALLFPRIIVWDPELATAIASLHASLERADTALERQSLLLSVLGMLIVRHSNVKGTPGNFGDEPAAVRKVREYLLSNYAEAISLHKLSEIAGLSPFHLLRTFRRSVGMPPHGYLRQIRVEQAKLMLAAGAAISEAAVAAGFVDQSHLTRYFKRILGMTPGTYTAAIPSKTIAAVVV